MCPSAIRTSTKHTHKKKSEKYKYNKKTIHYKQHDQAVTRTALVYRTYYTVS